MTHLLNDDGLHSRWCVAATILKRAGKESVRWWNADLAEVDEVPGFHHPRLAPTEFDRRYLWRNKMSAYIVITKTRTRDETELGLYAKQAPAFMAGHSISTLARFGRCEVKEGAAVEGVTIMQFATFEEAKAWYESPSYQEASQHRFRGGDYNVIIVDGIVPSPLTR